MHLAAEVLEEPFELVDRPVGGGQELGGVVAPGLEPADVVELGDQLAPEPLGPPADPDRVAAIEARGDSVGLAEDPRLQQPRVIPKPHGEVGPSVPGDEAVTPCAWQ